MLPLFLPIVLADREKMLFRLLLEACSKTETLVELRIAGGWVRDKLLGVASDDIDVAIGGMAGEPFAKIVQEASPSKFRISTIAANPDKSKHLQTATANILGLDVDFVNLRSESYNEETRVPKMDFGTPFEDAIRRDLTINSLFYNLHNGQIEDLTGFGLEDLKNGIIRTPLPPIQTFLDDPLRVLRVVRFASRFGYTLWPDIAKAASMQSIKDAFMRKISRERVGVEIEKMMKGRDAAGAIKIFHSVGYLPIIFTPPDNSVEIDMVSAVNASSLLQFLLQEKSIPWIGNLLQDDQLFKHLYLACAISTFRSVTYVYKRKTISAVRFIVLESLKLSTNDANVVEALLVDHQDISKLVKELSMDINPSTKETRVAIGALIIKLGLKLGEMWPMSLLMAMIIESLSSKDSAAIAKRYNAFFDRVGVSGLMNCWKMKPLLDGKEIAGLLGIKPGPGIGVHIHSLIILQLQNPALTSDDAIAYLAKQRTF